MKFSYFFFKHYFQIKNGGLKIFLQKILIFFLSISAPQYVFAIFIYIFIKLFSLFLIIRFQMLRNDKIGHYTENIELYLAEQKNLINKPQKLFYDFFIKQVRKSDIESMYNHHYFMCICTCICICIQSVYIAIAILLLSRIVSSFSLLGIGSN